MVRVPLVVRQAISLVNKNAIHIAQILVFSGFLWYARILGGTRTQKVWEPLQWLEAAMHNAAQCPFLLILFFKKKSELNQFKNIRIKRAFLSGL